MEERLFLDRIALDAADVSPRNAKTSGFVEPHLADADGAVGQRTAVAARVAAQAAVGENIVQLAFARFVRQDASKSRHWTLSL